MKKITLFISTDDTDVLENIVKWVEYYDYTVECAFEKEVEVEEVPKQ